MILFKSKNPSLRFTKHIFCVALLFFAWLCSYSRQEYALHEINTPASHPRSDTAEVVRLIDLAGDYKQIHLDSVLIYAEQALALAQSLRYERGIAAAHVQLAAYHQRKGNTSLALEHALKALKTYEKIGDAEGVAHAHVQIALVYKEIGGSEIVDEYLAKGIEHSRMAYETYRSVADTPGMTNSLNTMGIIFRDRAKRARTEELIRYYDSAHDCYVRAIELINMSGKGKGQLGRLYNNICQVIFEYKKDYNTALDYAFRAVDFNMQRNNQNSLTYNYLNIADIYRRQKKYAQALDYALKATAIAREQRSPARLADTYGMTYAVYKDMGRYDSAMHYYILSDHIVDSFANVRKTQQIAEMQTQYETVKKEAEIERLHTENVIKNKQIAFLAGGLLLFGVLTGTMIYLYRRVNNQKQLISLQSKKLELMMKELHHRVKNNLQIVSSLLSLQTYRLTDAESIAALRESQQRVQAMSFIHQRLYKTDELTTVNVKEYITDLTESLMASYGYGHDSFDLQISVDNEMLDVDKALPIGLIVNEIVTNAFKYAYKEVEHPSLHITCTESGNEINLTIQDNGKGLDEKKWKQPGGSFGKQLVNTLCRQLRAQQSLDLQRGTCFRFVIPKNAQAA